jgi:6,7-dimethyl-8-ribityllumazine synthase
MVVGKFNSLVTDRLRDGALAGLKAAGVDNVNVTLAHVPGSFELPVVAKAMAESGAFDAIICIGAVVRGATTHYEEVCSAATSGCSNAAASTGVHSRCLYTPCALQSKHPASHGMCYILCWCARCLPARRQARPGAGACLLERAHQARRSAAWRMLETLHRDAPVATTWCCAQLQPWQHHTCKTISPTFPSKTCQ